MTGQHRLACDGFGCDEDYPRVHPELGEFGFAEGKWLGWLYLDINRPDLTDRPLRFCGIRCIQHWLEWNSVRGGIPNAAPETADEISRQQLRNTIRIAKVSRRPRGADL